MAKFGINALSLSHNQTMEKQTQQNQELTKETAKPQTDNGVLFSSKDAEEYRAYKRRQKMTEVSGAIARSQSCLNGNEDVQRVCERAVRLKQVAVRLPLTKLSQAAYYLTGSEVKMDCVVGGNGETLAKVKAYETRLAVRRHAKEITVPVTPSLLDCCRFGEIRRELKRVRRAARKAVLKVRVEKTSSPTSIARVARIASEIGAKYFSVPYFKGCDKLRLDLTGGCLLEVSGVETAEVYKKLVEVGVSRIVTDRAWEIYTEWMKEATETFVPAHTPAVQETETEKAESELPKSRVESGIPRVEAKNPETDYHCRLEGSDLKFL